MDNKIDIKILAIYVSRFIFCVIPIDKKDMLCKVEHKTMFYRHFLNFTTNIIYVMYRVIEITMTALQANISEYVGFTNLCMEGKVVPKTIENMSMLSLFLAFMNPPFTNQVWLREYFWAGTLLPDFHILCNIWPGCGDKFMAEPAFLFQVPYM